MKMSTRERTAHHLPSPAWLGTAVHDVREAVLGGCEKIGYGKVRVGSESVRAIGDSGVVSTVISIRPSTN